MRPQADEITAFGSRFMEAALTRHIAGGAMAVEDIDQERRRRDLVS